MQAVQAQASEAGQDLELAQALWQLGCVLSDQARWADALAPLRQSLLLMESLEHTDTWTLPACAMVHSQTICSKRPGVPGLTSILTLKAPVLVVPVCSCVPGPWPLAPGPWPLAPAPTFLGTPGLCTALSEEKRSLRPAEISESPLEGHDSLHLQNGMY